MKLYGLAATAAVSSLRLAILIATSLNHNAIPASDWLSFSGALMGVGLGVVGALAVELERERRPPTRE